MSNLPALSTVAPATQTVRDETLYRTERIWLFRRHLPGAGGSFLCKQPLGPDAAQRLRYELGILQRLAGIEGVPRLSAHTVPDTMIAIDEPPNKMPLAQALRGTPRNLPALLPFALALTRILVAIHRAGVFHRNINPDNILLSGAKRQPMLINFNLATCAAEEQPAFVHHNEILGKLAYLAPEQTGRTGRTVDQRADLYALGVTFYELATGRPPFAAADQLELIHQLLTQVPTAPMELNPHLPLTLSNIIMRLLEKEPDRRYQSAVGLAHDLSQLQDALTQGGSAEFELGARDFASQLSLPSRLIGRDTEIAALQLAFDQALIGQRRGVLIGGAPGVGKSALINTLQPYVTAQRGWVVYGKFDQFRQDLETDAVRQAVRTLGRLLLAEPEHELAAQRARILQALDDNAALMVAEMPEFALLLDIAPRNVDTDPLNGTVRLHQATVDLLRAIVSPARPLVMVFDDLQWAGSAPSGLLNMLLMDTTLNGLLIVGTYRDAELNATHPLSTLLARWQQLPVPPLCWRLQNLPIADLATLLMEMLRLSPARAEDLATMVQERTGGNPYDTLELINALRREGVLLLGETGWEWDAATIRRYVIQGEVGDLLVARLRRLPPQTQTLMQVMACLIGETGRDLLQTASGRPEIVLEQQLLSALEDGVLVINQGNGTVSFRHDRVQQAAYDSIDAARRTELHLQLARRMSTGFAHLAAEQYLQALDLVRDPDEIRHVVSLFQNAAACLPITNFIAAERFLTAAIALLSSIKTAADEALLTTLNIDRHRALFNLGRFEEADGVYRLLEQNCCDPLQLVDSACLQISSLQNRNCVHEAAAFGFEILKKLGAEIPRADAPVDLEQRIDNLCRWAHQDNVAAELQRPEASNVLTLATAKLINRLMASAISDFDFEKLMWLVLESQRLWTEHGPNPALVGPLSHAAFITIATRQDYRSGYAAVQYLLTLIEPRGYEPATSQARFLFAFSASPWSEPLEDTVRHLQRAREGLLRSGDMQNACFSYLPTLTTQLDCAPTLANYVTEIEAAFALAAKSGNEMAIRPFLANRQLVRALRGETDAPGSFTDISFDETAYVEGMAEDQFAACFFYLARGLAAAVFGDAAALQRHTAAAMLLLPRIRGMYGSSLGYLLQALALAERIKHARTERNALLTELDVCRDWLALRAADCPVNFLHLHQWVEAERAWAIGDFQAATGAFDAALRAVEPHQRPWHRALITERAALFHCAHRLEHTGRMLLAEARRIYEIWGASGKVRELEKTHGFLRAAFPSPQQHSPSNAGASVEALDMLAIVRASQALSSETNLPQLQARVVELLSAMTGATQVQLVLRRDDPAAWVLSASDATGSASAPVTMDDADACNLLSLSAFHYAARTLEPLLVEDATLDDRFARDPYVAALERCSLLLVPIMSKGKPRAMLVMENRLSRGAFSAERLDAVQLIAGQLAVSLENALLYRELEQRVTERTKELVNSFSLLTATLESSTDGIIAHQFGGGVICYNTQYKTMWDMPEELLQKGMDNTQRIEWVAAQAADPAAFMERQREITARRETDAFEVIQLKDGRSIERVMKPQKIDGNTVGVVVSFRDITERKRAEQELEKIHRKLLDASRQAGMAEVASNVLHNVGNVLNSVNVSANLVAENMKRSKVSSLAKVAELLRKHQQDLAAFMTDDANGKHLPEFLTQLTQHLLGEQQATIKELELLRNNIDHIKEIVAMQQSYSKVSGVKEIVNVVDLIEDTLNMNAGALQRHGVEIIREFTAAPLLINAEKHKILQILVNLVRNAKYACSESATADKRVTLRVTHDDEQIKIAVIDNGVGISAENLTRIFGHGFTTRRDGHGYGLHSSALAAQELGGVIRVHSDGLGLGASFTLELPFQQTESSHA